MEQAAKEAARKEAAETGKVTAASILTSHFALFQA
jgi:hypothetical protein